MTPFSRPFFPPLFPAERSERCRAGEGFAWRLRATETIVELVGLVGEDECQGVDEDQRVVVDPAPGPHAGTAAAVGGPALGPVGDDVAITDRHGRAAAVEEPAALPIAAIAAAVPAGAAGGL